MRLLARIKLLAGAVFVVAIVAVLTTHLDKQMSTVHDDTATLKSQGYSIGTDYSGVVVQHYVQAGDQVRAGEPIAVVKSNLLSRDIANRLVLPRTSPYEIRGQNALVLRASSPGTVTYAPYINGAYVRAGAILARVQVEDTTYVEAQFRLTAQEYAEIRQAHQLIVTLPNDNQITASISRISVRTRGNDAATRVTATAPQLTGTSLFSAGTPVDVRVRLPRDGLLHSVADTVTGLLTPSSER